MFFETVDGEKYPVTQIVKIGKVRKVTFTSTHGDRPGSLYSVELLNGEAVDVHPYVIEGLMRQPVAGFPAHQGTYLVVRENDETHRWPVVGWSISQDGGVYPVTMNGVNSDTQDLHHVLLPSGEVTGYDQNWPQYEEWRAEQDAT
jgi:hypothetical protein